MLPFIRARLEAGRFAQQLRESLLTDADRWKIEADDDGNPSAISRKFRIATVRRRLRLCDAVHAYCDGTEIWLPLVARIRLRNALRLFIAREANSAWQAGEKKSS